MARRKNIFIQKSEEKRQVLNQQVNNVLGIQNVPIYFIENSPEEWDEENEQDVKKDFRMFPDGSYNIKSLFDGIINLLNINSDFIGARLIEHYFGPCNEKEDRCEVREVENVQKLERGEIQAACQVLNELGISGFDLNHTFRTEL